MNKNFYTVDPEYLTEKTKCVESLHIQSPVPVKTNSEEDIQNKYNGSCSNDVETESLFRNFCISNKYCWWQPSEEDEEEFSQKIDFCLETSLHGLKYIGQPQRHLSERIFWVVSFLVGCCVAVYLISDVWINYSKSPIIVTFQPFETTIDQIPFPAITICNMNKVLKSKAQEYINAKTMSIEEGIPSMNGFEREWDLYYLDHICSSSRSFSKKFNYSSTRGIVDVPYSKFTFFQISGPHHSGFQKFLSKSSQKCEDMLLHCVWQDEVKNCSDLFKANEGTEYGKCCTFNMVPQELLRYRAYDPDEDEDDIADWKEWDLHNDGLLIPESKQNKFPKRQYRAGRSSGLSILVDPGLSEYFCTDSDSKGFMMQPHLLIDEPHVNDFGIAIKPNTENFVSILPEITMANRDIQNFHMEKRECYFGGEFQLYNYKHYTVSNCLDECVANQTFNKCGCVLYYMPLGQGDRLCQPSKISCVENVTKTNLKRNIKKDCPLCYPTCTELEYHAQTTTAPMQNNVHLWLDKHNATAKWAENNVSIIHIYFGQDSTYPKLRTKIFSLSDLIANTGGLMGLCLGFSGLSLVECLYFFTLRAWCRSRRRPTMWTIMYRNCNKLYNSMRFTRKGMYESEISNLHTISVIKNANPAYFLPTSTR